MDEIDDAHLMERMYLRVAMARRGDSRRGGSRTAPTCPARTHCIDCGEPIPEARRLAVPGCPRCRDCQEDTERTYG